MEEKIREINIELAKISHKYLSGVNSVSSFYVDDEARELRSMDLKGVIEDPEPVISEHVEQWLSYCPFNYTEIFNDFKPEYRPGAKDEDPDELAFEILNKRVTGLIMDLLRSCDGELYELTKKGTRRYTPNGYHVYLDVIGAVHLRTPEEFWGVLYANWSD